MQDALRRNEVRKFAPRLFDLFRLVFGRDGQAKAFASWG